jgi:hypothetical protein
MKSLDVDSFLQELTSKMQILEQEELEKKRQKMEDEKDSESKKMETGDSERYGLEISITADIVSQYYHNILVVHNTV